MYKILLSVILALYVTTAVGQKVGYVDSEYILSKVPEYAEAQNQLDAISAEWQQQIEKKYQLIDQMYKDLQAEEILLTKDMKQKRMDDIRKKEDEACGQYRENGKYFPPNTRRWLIHWDVVRTTTADDLGGNFVLVVAVVVGVDHVQGERRI